MYTLQSIYQYVYIAINLPICIQCNQFTNMYTLQSVYQYVYLAINLPICIHCNQFTNMYTLQSIYQYVYVVINLPVCTHCNQFTNNSLNIATFKTLSSRRCIALWMVLFFLQNALNRQDNMFSLLYI